MDRLAHDLKPTIPEVAADFVAYYERPGNGAWGSLHVVLDDGNVSDADVRACIEWAKERGDQDGERLANILLRMSRSQRLRLPRSMHDHAGIA